MVIEAVRTLTGVISSSRPRLRPSGSAGKAPRSPDSFRVTLQVLRICHAGGLRVLRQSGARIHREDGDRPTWRPDPGSRIVASAQDRARHCKMLPFEGLFTSKCPAHTPKANALLPCSVLIHEILRGRGHRIRRRIAVRGTSQRAHGDPCERRRDARVDSLRRQNLASRSSEREKLGSLSEQDSASGQLIENENEKMSVRPSSGVRTLLGAHVAGLSFDHAGRRLAIRGHRFAMPKSTTFVTPS